MSGSNAQLTKPRRYFFLGDSITDDGRYISYIRMYFQRYLPDQAVEFINLGVSGETASGLNEPSLAAPRPWVHDRIDGIIREIKQEDVAVFCYGMNDGIYFPLSEQRFEAYRKGIAALVQKLKSARCRVVAMTPPPFDSDSFQGDFAEEDELKLGQPGAYRGYDSVLACYGNYLQSEPLADEVIDVHTPLAEHIQHMSSRDPGYQYGDGIHPDSAGHWVIAKVILKALFDLTVNREPDYVSRPQSCADYLLEQRRHALLSNAWRAAVSEDPAGQQDSALRDAILKAAELSGEIERIIDESGTRTRCEESIYKGCRRLDFYINGRESVLIEPKQARAGNPWVWRTEFFEAFDNADRTLLENGYFRAYHCLSDQYGSPESVELMRIFRCEMVSRFGLNEKPVVVGLSRGGLYALNFAAKYPDMVSALYLDAPVVDICSWPAGRGVGEGAEKQWEECKNAYHLNENTAGGYIAEAKTRIKNLAQAKVPLILVAGDSDKIVPYEENGRILQQIYEENGGDIEVYLKPGVDHHPHGLENPTPIVSFIERHS